MSVTPGRRHALDGTTDEKVTYNQTFWPDYDGFTVQITDLPLVSQYDANGAYSGSENEVKIAYADPVSLVNKWNWVAWASSTPALTDVTEIQFRTRDTHAGFTATFSSDPVNAVVIVNGKCCHVGKGFQCTDFVDTPSLPPSPSPPPAADPTVVVDVTETAGIATCGVLVECREVNLTDSTSHEGGLSELAEYILENQELIDAATQTVGDTIAAVTASTVATSVATSIVTSVASSVATSIATSTAGTAAATSSFASLNVFNPGLFNLIDCAQGFATNSYMRADIGQSLRVASSKLKIANFNVGWFDSTLFTTYVRGKRNAQFCSHTTIGTNGIVSSNQLQVVL